MKLLIGSSHTSDERVSRRRQRVARGGWIVCAIGLLVHFVIGVPAYYQSLFVPCILSELGLCSMGQLTSKNFESLQHMHFTVQTYAITVTAVATATSLLFWVVGILIFWRKGQDWMGLFVSFLLIVYGSVGVNDTFLYIGKAPSAQRRLACSSSSYSGLLWVHSCNLSHRSFYATLVLDHHPSVAWSSWPLLTRHRLRASSSVRRRTTACLGQHDWVPGLPLSAGI